MVKIMRGFTLIEIMIASGLVGLLLVGVVGIFLSTVKGGNQARLQAEVKTRGDYAMSTMERTIRNAVKMPECPSAHSIIFSVKNDDGSVTNQQYTITDGALTVGVGEKTSSLIATSGQKDDTFIVDDSSSFSCYPGGAYNSGSIGIRIVLRTSASSGQIPPQTFQTMVTIRNNP
jgi:prepilin-type N-terminal cleavage/methylation domain-containing protein